MRNGPPHTDFAGSIKPYKGRTRLRSSRLVVRKEELGKHFSYVIQCHRQSRFIPYRSITKPEQQYFRPSRDRSNWVSPCCVGLASTVLSIKCLNVLHFIDAIQARWRQQTRNGETEHFDRPSFKTDWRNPLILVTTLFHIFYVLKFQTLFPLWSEEGVEILITFHNTPISAVPTRHVTSVELASEQPIKK